MWLIRDLTFLLAGVTLIFAEGELAKQKIQSYASCQTDRDCKENAFCFGNDDTVPGKCKCISGFELIRNTTYYECLAGVKLGEACEKRLECKLIAGELAICNDYKICECNEESHNFVGFCHMKIKIGDICQKDYNCYLNDGTVNGTHGYCVDGRCKCPRDQRPSTDGTRCLASRKLGEKCIADEECASTTPNTRCSDVCRCAVEYTLSRDETTCVKAATKFNEKCDFDGQCSEYLQQSICTDTKTCGCEDGFHGFGAKCVPTRKAGQRCEEDAQCLYDKKLINNVECDKESQTCKCLFGAKEDGSCKIEKSDDDSSAARQNSIICFNILFAFGILKLLFM